MGLQRGKIPKDFEANLGTLNRAVSKVGDEALAAADLVIAIGTNFPFANLVYRSSLFQVCIGGY